MPASTPLSTSPKRETRLGLVMRIGFYFVTAWVGAQFLEGIAGLLLHSAFLGAILGVFAMGLLANFLTMRIFDRRPLVDIGLGSGAGTGRNFVFGLALGGGTAALILCIPLFAGAAHLVPRPSAVFSWLSVLFYLLMLIFGAAGEEILFRGYAFQLMIEKLGPFATILPVGVLFGFAHALNPNASQLGVINTALWGILLGFAFYRSHDLWLPIGLHYGWNAVLPLFGTNLSGITIEVTRYSYQCDLAPLWSGGPYGPEGGLGATMAIAVLFLALAKVPVVPQFAAIAVSLNEER